MNNDFDVELAYDPALDFAEAHLINILGDGALKAT